MIRNVRKLLKLTSIKSEPSRQPPPHSDSQDFLTESFDQNIKTLQSIYENCFDVIFRPFSLNNKTRAMIIYIEGISDARAIDEYVLLPLMQDPSAEPNQMPVSKVKKVYTFTDCIESIAIGNPVFLYENESVGVSLGLEKWKVRGIEEPVAESGVRGPREGFNETLQVSTSQIRRIIKSPALKMQSMKIGKLTGTSVVITYIDGIADPALIEEITNRLKRIEIDGILESEMIEDLIEDNPYSPFPQIMSTERPDVVCANLLEGRAAVLVEGSPFALVAPISFFSLLQAHEDYYQRFMFGTFIRWLRYVFLGVALLLPSLYVAVLSFHQEMVPEALLISIASAREEIPFPVLVEALLMEITFEALREAGVRLPKQIGSAVSIVGALVIGQAAVQAGLVSAPMVIVVAITGIASFMIPRYVAGLSIRLLRFPLLLLASTVGLLGIVMGVIAIAIHLCRLRSFGEPYLAPLAPLQGRQLKDVLWKAPLWMMDTRPHLTRAMNTFRQSPEQAPGPSQGGETP